MEFTLDARVPEEYIEAPSLRMEIYHRMGEAFSIADVDAIYSEMKDRFGKPPESVINLYYLSRLRVIASLHHIISLKIEKLSVTAEYNKGKAVEHKKWLVGRYNTAKELEGKHLPLLKSL